jgi:hypothetical protein
MEVNWDEIEKRYVEIPTHHTGHFTYAPQLSNDSVTVFNNNPVPNSQSPMLNQKDWDIQRPNAIDGLPSVKNDQSVEIPDEG